ncbi:MAG: methyl-accepting chemotaxis protein [Firmicutes bacterium]|nr:methyl-accepting chemotaxis protein [Bacillota bacterium]
MKKQHKLFVEFLPFIKEVLQKDIMASVTDLNQFIAYVPGDAIDVKVKKGMPIPEGDPLRATISNNQIITAIVPKEVYGVPFRAVTYPIRDKKGNCIGAIGIAESLVKEQRIKEALDDIVSKIEKSNHNISSISDDVHDMSLGIQELSSVVEEVNASIVEITDLSDRITSNVDSVANASQNVIKEAENGIVAVKNINDTLAVTVDEILRVREQIEHLNTSIENANKTVSLINSIAEQTNLLALNASIEAARAGEHGRGFAVVADEVGKLAVQSRTSSVEIGEMMKGIQNEIQAVVSKVNQAVQKTDSNKASVVVATQNIERILTDIQGVDHDIQGVRVQIKKQSNNTNEIRQAVDSITVTVEEKASVGTGINKKLKTQSDDMDRFEKEIRSTAKSLME